MDDLQLRSDGDTTSDPVLPARGPGLVPILAVLVLLALGGGAAYWFYSSRPPAPTPVAETRPAPPPASTSSPTPVTPLGGPAEPVTLPPLDGSDEAARSLIAGLSSSPLIATWLRTDGVIRHLAAALDNVAQGQRPIAHVRMLAPNRPFQVRSTGSGMAIDPESYRRYDRFAEALESIDATGAARVYGTLKPRLGDAFSELGRTGEAPDQAVERAIVLLLDTPVPTDPIAVVPKGVGYAFADARLEALAPAQKQLIRMGPDNARRIQQSLRGIARALGIPDSRLPAHR